MPRAQPPSEATATCLTAHHAVEIDAPVERVFAHWTRYEQLPRCTDSVRRTQRIGERRVLWDVDVSGRQLVWEALIVEHAPGKRVRWESRSGPRHRGEVRFEALPGRRTRLCVEIAYWPRGILERLGARIGLLDIQLRRDLARFRRFVESLPASAPLPA